MISCITLTTDFGLEDEYVGVLKGVLLRTGATVPVIDLCHRIPPQNVLAAALLLASSFRYFPANSLHLAVVDPGVGSDRRAILVEAAHHFFLAPDNGLLTCLLDADLFTNAWAVTDERLFLHPRSHSFDGRDLFAPVAARLSTGLAPNAVGPALSPTEIHRLPIPKAQWNAGQQTLVGQVIGADHFGNLLTSIQQQDLSLLLQDSGPESLQIQCANHIVSGLATSYFQAEPGQLLALIGSRGALELACRDGAATSRIDHWQDAPVVVRNGRLAAQDPRTSQSDPTTK